MNNDILSFIFMLEKYYKQEKENKGAAGAAIINK